MQLQQQQAVGGALVGEAVAAGASSAYTSGDGVSEGVLEDEVQAATPVDGWEEDDGFGSADQDQGYQDFYEEQGSEGLGELGDEDEMDDRY